jgi:hypothetical protein
MQQLGLLLTKKKSVKSDPEQAKENVPGAPKMSLMEMLSKADGSGTL